MVSNSYLIIRSCIPSKNFNGLKGHGEEKSSNIIVLSLFHFSSYMLELHYSEYGRRRR